MKTSPLLTISAASAALACMLFVTPAGAQQETSTIVGTVLDQTTLLPIPNGVVTLVEHRLEIRADAQGNFLFESLPPGGVTLRVDADRYSSAVDRVETTAGEMSVVQVHLLPMSRVLNDVMVRTGRVPFRDPNTLENLAEDITLSAADLIAQKMPGMMVGRSGGVGNDNSLIIRGVSTLQGNPQPTIYLDGVRIATGRANGSMGSFGVLNDIPASQVRRIRILKGPSAAAQFGDSANGVILIETIRGSQ